jgi:hypothetical protein
MSLKVELDEGVTYHVSHGVVAWTPRPTPWSPPALVSVPLPNYGRTRRWTTRQLEEVGAVPPGTARRYTTKRRRAKLKGNCPGVKP